MFAGVGVAVVLHFAKVETILVVAIEMADGLRMSGAMIALLRGP